MIVSRARIVKGFRRIVAIEDSPKVALCEACDSQTTQKLHHARVLL